MSYALDRYAVFGNPISQSKSPQIHSAFARQTGELVSYSKQLVAENAFNKEARAFFQGGGKGLNITMPFKHDALEFADSLTERAKKAGAVNTLTLKQDGSVEGDNTDGYGLVSDICDRLGWQIKGQRILFLGAGGAVRGVLGPVLDRKPKQICIANRTLSKAEDLARQFSGQGDIKAIGLKELTVEQQPFDLLINGTSLSMSGGRPPVPEHLISANACAYDMVYGAEPTVFIEWASSHGCHVSDGLGMLVGQAAEAFRLWRGVLPDYKTVLESLRKDLLN